MSDPFVWENQEQANDRLSGTYLRFGDDIVYIRECRGDSSGSIDIYFDELTGKRRSTQRAKVNDPLWHNFRMMPPLGWINTELAGVPHATLVTRRTTRTRRHGINHDSCLLTTVNPSGGVHNERAFNLSQLYSSEGASQALREEYPTVSEIVDRLPNLCCTAASPLICIARDSAGLCKVYRKGEELGYVSKGGVYLMPSGLYRVDELLEEPNFDIRDIKEF